MTWDAARMLRGAWIKQVPDRITIPRPDGAAISKAAKASLASDEGRAALASIGFPIHYASTDGSDDDGAVGRHRPKMRNRNRPDGPYIPDRAEGGD